MTDTPLFQVIEPGANNDPSRVLGIPIDAAWLRTICLEAGAADAGFVEITRPAIAEQKNQILASFPRTRSLIILAQKIEQTNLQTLSGSVKNTEFHLVSEQTKVTARQIAKTLVSTGIWAVSYSGMFPMEMERWPGPLWDLGLKPLAIEAGLGQMGHHRLIIHPELGSSFCLSAVLLDQEISHYSKPVAENPCIDCKLCVAACPTGAIANDGRFDFSACITHNYREKLGGFSDWVETIVESKNRTNYRHKVSDAETVSWWASLSGGANTKCDHCMAVCPASPVAKAHYLSDKSCYVAEVVKPLQQKQETVFVVPGSDAESYAAKRFPHKKLKPVGNGIRAASISSFIQVLPHLFQREQSVGVNARYHLSFTGAETLTATVVIARQHIEVSSGLIGKADLTLKADAKTWLGFLAKEKSLLPALLLGKIRIKGSPRLLKAFGKCFPS